MLNHHYASSYSYFLYGHYIRSVWPLPYLVTSGSISVDFEFIAGSDSFFSETLDRIPNGLGDTDWFHHVRLPGGSDFLRWTGLFDFLVSADGRQIVGRSLTGDTLEKFQTYLLGQVLSFAMVRQGIEPLHSTVVVIDGEAVAFLGDCGYGKSTLAGAFLQAGLSILTDDMLIIKEQRGAFLGYPGPPRIKLFPEIAKVLIAEDTIVTPMNPHTPKLIIPLPDKQYVKTPVPLRAFYALQSPDHDSRSVEISPLSQRQAVLTLISNTFNTLIRGPHRMAQQFDLATQLSASLPIKLLSYPRDLSWLPEVLDAIQKDIA